MFLIQHLNFIYHLWISLNRMWKNWFACIAMNCLHQLFCFVIAILMLKELTFFEMLVYCQLCLSVFWGSHRTATDRPGWLFTKPWTWDDLNVGRSRGKGLEIVAARVATSGVVIIVAIIGVIDVVAAAVAVVAVGADFQKLEALRWLWSGFRFRSFFLTEYLISWKTRFVA